MKESIRVMAISMLTKLVTNKCANAQESGHCDDKKLADLSRGLLIAALFEVYVEPHLIQPHHIIRSSHRNNPICKPHRDPKLQSRGIG